jgi:spermidine synthase
VRLTFGDPRRFLERSDAYDLILVGMPEPASGQMNRFYTREFFTRCAERLSEEGVLALRLRGSENLWTPQLARRTGSIHRALRSVFDDVVVLPGVTNIIVASRAPLERDAVSLGGRLTERGIEALLVIPAYVKYLYTNDRFFELNDLLTRIEAPVNSDARPICYQYTLLLWLSRFFLAAALMEVPDPDPVQIAGSPWLWLGIVVVAGVLLLSRRWPVCRRSLLAAAAGFVGMVLETALILQYQTIRGVLYQDIGLLLTMFMAGLALGSAAVHGLARRRSGKGLTRSMGVVLLAAFVVLNLMAAWLLPAGLVTGLGGTSALLLACGFLVAALFAYASLHQEPDQKMVISPLYAADLAGGCAGSLAASLFLIPVAGFWGAAVSMVLAVALAALLL